MARHLSATLAFALFLALTACARQVPAPHRNDPSPVIAPPPTGPGLIIKVQPADAVLILDGTSYGDISKLETDRGLFPLKSGIYQVSIKKTGYVSWRAEVTINDRPETLAVTLKAQ